MSFSLPVWLKISISLPVWLKISSFIHADDDANAFVLRTTSMQKLRWFCAMKLLQRKLAGNRGSAAVDHKPTNKMVGCCFGFNGPLRQYFNLYQAVSQRGRKGREKIEESKNVQTNPTRTYCKRSRPLPYYHQIVGRPGTGSLPSTIAPPDHPSTNKMDNIFIPLSMIQLAIMNQRFHTAQLVLLAVNGSTRTSARRS